MKPLVPSCIAALLLTFSIAVSACGDDGAPPKPTEETPGTESLPVVTHQVGAFRLKIDGSALQRLAEPSAYVSPDGSRIATIRTGQAGADAVLILANTDGANEVEVGAVAKQGTAVPVWSPDGGKVVVGGATEGTLLIVNADATGLRELAVGAAEFPETTWSPDGTKIAFVPRGTQPGRRTRLAILGVESGTAEPLVSVDTQPQQISWSGDEQRLAFAIIGEGVFIVNSDGTDLKQISTGYSPALSYDGRYVLVSRGPAEDSGSALVRVDVETLEESVLFEWQATTGGTIDTAAWSPNGEKIAFIARPEDALGIYIVNTDGSDLYQLVAPFGNIVSELQWLSDQQLYFVTESQH